MSIPSYRRLRQIWLLPNILSPDDVHEFLPSFEGGQSLDVLAKGLGDLEGYVECDEWIEVKPESISRQQCSSGEYQFGTCLASSHLGEDYQQAQAQTRK